MPHWLRLIVFLTVVFLIVAVVHVFVHRQVVRAFTPPRAVRVALTVLFFSGPLALIAGRLALNAFGGPGPATMSLTV